MLEERDQPYVLAVRSNHHLRFLDGWALVQTDPATMADELPPEAWATHAAGEGAKGMRLYDWARIPLPWTRPDGFERFLLIRRSRRDPEHHRPLIQGLRQRSADNAGGAGHPMKFHQRSSSGSGEDLRSGHRRRRLDYRIEWIAEVAAGKAFGSGAMGVPQALLTAAMKAASSRPKRLGSS